MYLPTNLQWFKTTYRTVESAQRTIRQSNSVLDQLQSTLRTYFADLLYNKIDVLLAFTGASLYSTIESRLIRMTSDFCFGTEAYLEK